MLLQQKQALAWICSVYLYYRDEVVTRELFRYFEFTVVLCFNLHTYLKIYMKNTTSYTKLYTTCRIFHT